MVLWGGTSCGEIVSTDKLITSYIRKWERGDISPEHIAMELDILIGYLSAKFGKKEIRLATRELRHNYSLVIIYQGADINRAFPLQLEKRFDIDHDMACKLYDSGPFTSVGQFKNTLENIRRKYGN